jgi:hypothetical protein
MRDPLLTICPQNAEPSDQAHPQYGAAVNSPSQHAGHLDLRGAHMQKGHQNSSFCSCVCGRKWYTFPKSPTQWVNQSPIASA